MEKVVLNVVALDVVGEACLRCLETKTWSHTILSREPVMKNTYLCQYQNSGEKVSIDVRHSNIRQPSPCDYQDRPRGRGNCTCHHAQYTTKQKMKLAAWLVLRLLLSAREAAEETEIPKTHI